MVDVRGDVLRPPHGTTPAVALVFKVRINGWQKVQSLFKGLHTTYFSGLYAYNYMHSCQQFLLPLEVFDTLYVYCRASQQGNIILSVHFC